MAEAGRNQQNSLIPHTDGAHARSNNNEDLLDILGLTLAADLDAVRSAYYYVRREIHPDIFWHSAADTAFQNWAGHGTSGGRHGIPHRDLQRQCNHQRDRNRQVAKQLNAPSKRADDQATEHAQTQAPLPAEDNLFGHYVHLLNLSDPAHGWTQALEFLSNKELAGELFELRDFSVSILTFLDHKLRTAFQDCLHKVLLLTSKFEGSI